MTAAELSPRLQAAVARHIGGPGTVRDLARLTGGATKTTWTFDADIDGTVEAFVLQVTDVGASAIADPLAGFTPRLTAAEDARIMLAAVAAGIPAPRVRAVLDAADGLGAGHITARVDGETLGPRILRDPRFAAARDRLVEQCAHAAAAIHRIDPSSVAFLKRQDAAAQLSAYRRVVDHFGHRLPALELGLAWIENNLPTPTRHTVVHGDFRLGNFVVADDGLRCVLDWELAQTGDPLQDLGWLCCKTWRFGGALPAGGFAAREELFAAYEQASGFPIDPAHVRFWEAFANVKWAIMCLRKGLRHRDGVEPISIEQSAIGRRVEEPLWDFLNLIEGRD